MRQKSAENSTRIIELSKNDVQMLLMPKSARYLYEEQSDPDENEMETVEI